MHLTQGTFSYLPPLTDDEIAAQIQYMLDNEWAVSIEYTDDPHPRNVYWEMFGLPLFDLKNPSAILDEIRTCRLEHPNVYIRVNAYDRSLGRQTIALSFIVQRPRIEPGFELIRTETSDRRIQYTLRSYATERPHGERYS
jgi:ribulose-bisphosphate carboxylase small chain